MLLADAVGSRYTTRFISDILTARGGELRIAERRALPDEVGIRASDLVFAIEPRKP